MKKLLSFIIFFSIFLMTSQCFASWTLAPSVVSKVGHYMTWKVVCTSDGGSLSATDLVPLMTSDMQRYVRGATLMIMKVSPGTSSAAPTSAINVTLSDSQGDALFTATGYSYSAVTTGISLATNYNQYFTVYNSFYLTLNNIGAAGVQVTLYFDCWIE